MTPRPAVDSGAAPPQEGNRDLPDSAAGLRAKTSGDTVPPSARVMTTTPAGGPEETGASLVILAALKQADLCDELAEAAWRDVIEAVHRGHRWACDARLLRRRAMRVARLLTPPTA